MKKLIAVGVAAVLVASGVSAAAPAAAEAWSYRSCGITDYSHWTYDRGSISGASTAAWARRVSCPKARYIATHFAGWSSWHSPNYRRAEYWRGPWYCYSRAIGIEGYRAVCKASYGRRVKAAGGA